MSGIDFDRILSGLGNVSLEHLVTNIGTGLAIAYDQISQFSAEQAYRDCMYIGQQLHLPQLAEAADMHARIINLSLIFAIAESPFIKERVFKLQPAHNNDSLPANWINADFEIDGIQIPCRYVRAPNEKMIMPFLGGFYSQIAEYREIIEECFLKNGISCMAAQHPRCQGNWLDIYQSIPHKLIEQAQLQLKRNATPYLPMVWGSHSAGCAMFEIDRRENDHLKNMIQNELNGIVHVHPYFGPSGATKQYNSFNRKIFNSHALSNSTRRYGYTWGDILFQFMNIKSIRRSGSIDKITPLFPETLALTQHIETHLDHIQDLPDYDLSHLQHYYFITARNDHLVCSRVAKDVAKAAGAERVPVEGGHTPTADQLAPVINLITEMAEPKRNVAPRQDRFTQSHDNILLQYKPA